MPWSSNSDLPVSVRGALPAAAQTRFRQVANDRMGSGDSEQSAIRQAWSVVGRGWEKPAGGGKWVRKTGTNEDWRDTVTEKNFVKADVVKVDEELGLVFGWGIICKVEGEEYFDSQGDHIPEDSMLKAATDFMENSRISGDMHARDAAGVEVPDGGVVFSFPMTTEVAKAMGIETARTGWMVAVRPSPEVLAKYKSGEYTGFSIGGTRGVDEEVD